MKYLLQAIEAKRDAVQLSDSELRKLLVEVRSGKDDRIEFIESMTRLVEELRSSEHAVAFLTKVAKRDAPDYYDVIKNPMDLGTMLRNVKSGRYKSKAQFMRDLDLIWDNCLTYNSEPTHPLRRSVQMLRAKANHLLTYVNDTNDVKEALSQWKTSSTVSSARRSEGPLLTGLPWADSPHEGASGTSNRGVLMNSRSMSMSLKRVNAALSDTPFEQRPALLRSVEGMSTFATLDESLSRADEHFEKVYMTNGASSEAGPSRKPLTSFDIEPGKGSGVAATVSGDLLRSLEMGTSGGVLRNALTLGCDEEELASTNNGKVTSNGIANGISMNGSLSKQGKRRESEPVPYPLDFEELSEGIVGDQFQLGAWWNSTCGSSLLASGISPLPTSIQVEARPNLSIGNTPRKRRRKLKDATSKHPFGGIKALEKNVSIIAKLRKTHAKFGALTSHIENDEPIPAALAVVSSDESEGEQNSQRDEKQESKKVRKRQKELDMPAASMHDSSRNPFPKLASEGATGILESKTQFLLAHAGFEGAQRAAADVITDVASEYIMNLGRTLRMYVDQFAHEMSVEEIILHTLFENGGMDVRNLESYVVDDVLRYGGKMSDLLRKLQSSYRDTLNSANLTMEDEAYFAENAEGNNDQIMSGTFAQGMGDDFFGFKEMGLDKELGIDMSQLIVPSKLFNKGAATAAGHSRNIGSSRPGHLPGAMGGLRGPGGSSAEVLLFEPPPPYVPLTESAISAQIGLLQPFYRDLIRSRGQWQQKSSRRRRDASREGEDVEEDEEDGEIHQDEEQEDGVNIHRRNYKSIFFLPEEEMERQRYKVPPNGKMPKREMKVKGGDQGNNNTANGSSGEKSRQNAAAANSASSAAATSTSVKTKSSSSKKKKKEAS